MRLRITESEWVPFANELRARTDVESAGIILAERMGGGTFVARQLTAISHEGYLVRRPAQLRIAPTTLNRMVRPARDHGWSVFTVHTHPNTHEPWFSLADDTGDSKLMPSLHAQMDGPHGSVVIAGATGSTIGRAFGADGIVEPLDVVIVGQVLDRHAGSDGARGDGSWYARQQLALGSEGQANLRRLRVAIVGLGGTGSVCLMQLAHLGVGHITLVDADAIEDTNVSRVLGCTTRDAGATSKVEVARRYVRGLGFDTTVRALEGALGHEVEPHELVECDVILSCVDRHTPRALLNRLSYEALVPVIDMGSAFRVDRTGRISASAGRVVVVGPGRACLGCWGHISGQKLRIESLSPANRMAEAAEGYVQGADVPQPSVVAFNTMLAGSAVIEMLRLVTGFAGAKQPPARLSFAFEDGTVRRNGLLPGQRCRICGIGRSCHPKAT